MSFMTLFNEYTSNFKKISGDYDKLVAEAQEKKEGAKKKIKQKFQVRLRSEYKELKKTHDVIDDVMKDTISDSGFSRPEEFEVKHMFDVKSSKYFEPVEFVDRYIVVDNNIKMIPSQFCSYFLRLIIDNYMNIYIPSLKLYIVNSYTPFSKFCLCNVDILSKRDICFDDHPKICTYLMTHKYEKKYIKKKRTSIFLEKIGITKNLTILRNFSLLEKKFVEATNMIKETKQKLKNVREAITTKDTI
jgi:hypothetical protein